VKDTTGTAYVVSFVKAKRANKYRRVSYSPLALDHPPGTRLLIEATVKRWGREIELQYLDSQILRRPRTTVEASAPLELAPGQEVPVYPLTDGLFQNQIRPAIRELVATCAESVPETLPAPVRAERRLVGVAQALRDIHWPPSEQARQRARRRLVFEEFFLLQLALAVKQRALARPGQGLQFAVPDGLVDELQQAVPFPLTAAQRRVIGEIAADMASDRSMNRLLQGDVGSGKTVVAVAALLIAARNGWQSAVMAPTEILAGQHFLVLSRLLAPLGITCELLVGAIPAKEKKRVRAALASGEAQVAIGTQALLQEGVEFSRLGLVVVDEQHRFGVMQRAGLREKGRHPEVLVMTATPIPRTLALTVYGDLEVSVLDEMPPGRRPVKTEWYSARREQEAYRFLRAQVAEGRQAYVVCPLVEESEKLEVEAATRLAQHLATEVFPDLRVGLIHGRMKTVEKDEVMEHFRSGAIDVLTATSVIEVGIDMPNASVMLILNAERFGLAQLHQLRGRVGRGEHQAYCVLVTDARYGPQGPLLRLEDDDKKARQRMRVITQEGDGFAIAEEDLLLRGPGEFYGTRQHGLPDLKLARIIEDVGVLQEAREAARALLESDPSLGRREHAALRRRLEELQRKVDLATP
jgi:ATP-dependent DNA helicase RecG